MIRYAVSGLFKQDTNNRGRGHIMGLKDFSVEKPTIICLGGDQTFRDSLIKDLCDTVGRIIGLGVQGPREIASYNNIDVVGIYYGQDKETDKTFCLSEEDRDDIVNHILLPLCVDEEGKLLPLEQICKNFSLLNFFTHCHGAFELYKITAKLHKILLDKGLTNEQAHEVYAHSFHCSYAANWHESFYPTMYMYSLIDACFRHIDYVYSGCYGEVLDGVSIKYDLPGKFMTENISSRNYNEHVHHDSIIVFSSRLVNPPPEGKRYFEHIYDEHSYRFLDRCSKNWRSTGVDSVYTPNADLVSQMAAYAMAVNITASLHTYRTNKLTKRMPIVELKTELESLIESFRKEDLQLHK